MKDEQLAAGEQLPLRHELDELTGSIIDEHLHVGGHKPRHLAAVDARGAPTDGFVVIQPLDNVPELRDGHVSRDCDTDVVLPSPEIRGHVDVHSGFAALRRRIKHLGGKVVVETR